MEKYDLKEYRKGFGFGLFVSFIVYLVRKVWSGLDGRFGIGVNF